jgi:NitT/TauT family transport system substrate-binding protein
MNIASAVRKGAFVAIASLGIAGPASAADPVKATMYLDFLVNGYHAPFYLAVEKGWYKEAGLDITVSPGKGTADSIKTVGTNNAEFGFPDLGAAAKAISEGIPITAVAAILQDTPSGIISFADKPIKAPKDLEGKSIAVAPFGATAILLPAFAKKNNIDMTKVNTVTYNFGAMVPSFLTNKVDSTIGYYFGEYLAAKTESKNKEVLFMSFAKNGVASYSNGIVVNNAFLAAKPEAVAAFVKTSLKAVQYTIDHVDEAIAATAKHTETPAATLKQQLVLALEFVNTPEAKKNGFGVMTAERWASTQAVQVEFGQQKERAPDDKLFTNKFVK